VNQVINTETKEIEDYNDKFADGYNLKDQVIPEEDNTGQITSQFMETTKFLLRAALVGIITGISGRFIYILES